MNSEIQPPLPTPASSPLKVGRVVGIVLLTILLSVGITLWIITTQLFPSDFKPVRLNQQENRQLQQKLQQFDNLQQVSRNNRDNSTLLSPEPYSEEGASREISLSEKELNALLAKNTDLAHRLAIDLSDNLASGKLLIPLDPEFPIFGGKTLKLTAGMDMHYADGNPVIILKGVSVWGIPMPNAWLGNMKNIDLVQEFGSDKGFWKAFADGVDEIEVKEGKLRIKLKE
ncbi:MAG: arginine N-succinyltransferase [Gammaproteobacteria bacterium]|nr:arginine N-succinyltransferase [Gammaproteobacteria bacterium]